MATVLVGDNPASHVYVRSKQKACQELGIESFGYDLPATASQHEVETLVKKLNDDPNVNGILVQLPLPAGLDEERVLSSIRIEKDVDGFHSMNIGRLAQKGREPLFIPCTPAGVMYLLNECDAVTGWSKRSRVGPVEYCWHAGRLAVGAGERHNDYLPLEDQKFKGRCSWGRCIGRSGGTA